MAALLDPFIRRSNALPPWLIVLFFMLNVAGVIGHTKFHYDVWGDPVNVASRMESRGQPGKIQISRKMYELLQAGYICEPRGTIEVKGKGRMETWFLIDRRQPET